MSVSLPDVKTAITIVLILAALAAGLFGYRNLRASRPGQPVSTDPVFEYAAENAGTLREQVMDSKDREQRQANEQHLQIDELNAGIEREPENADLRAKRALWYDLKGDNEAALSDIEVALRADNPRRYYFLFLRHSQLVKLGRPKEALADVLAAIELAPPEFSYHWNAADLYQQLGNPGAGVAILDAGVRKYPDNFTLRANRAEFLASIGRYEEALTDMTLAIEKEPDEFQRHTRTYARVRYLTELRRFDEALEGANRLLKENPRDTIALAARGVVYEAMGDQQRADADYDMAMNITMDR